MPTESDHNLQSPYYIYRAWDMGCVVPKETLTPHEEFHTVLVFLRFAMYIFLLMLTWITATGSQLSLLFLVRALNYDIKPVSTLSLMIC